MSTKDQRGRGAEETEEAASAPGRRSQKPDVYLDVPQVDVEELVVDVQDLRARVSLSVEVLDLVKLNVGADVVLGSVHLDLKGVHAQAVLKVRLDRVAEIVGRVLETVDRNPQVLDHALHALERTVEPIAEGGAGAVEAAGAGTALALEHTGRGVGDVVDRTAAGAGDAVHRTAAGLGDAVAAAPAALGRLPVDGAGRAAAERERPRRSETRASAKKAAAKRRTGAEKTAAKKTGAKKSAAKKTAAKKAAKRRSS